MVQDSLSSVEGGARWSLRDCGPFVFFYITLITLHPRKSFIENQCSSLLLFNSCLWTQTRKKRVVYCKFYLQFTHSAYLTNEFVQKEKIQFCWMTKTLHRKDWLKHFTTRFLRLMHWITKHYFVSSKSISKMQDINKARIGFREI